MWKSGVEWSGVLSPATDLREVDLEEGPNQPEAPRGHGRMHRSSRGFVCALAREHLRRKRRDEGNAVRTREGGVPKNLGLTFALKTNTQTQQKLSNTINMNDRQNRFQRA